MLLYRFLTPGPTIKCANRGSPAYWRACQLNGQASRIILHNELARYSRSDARYAKAHRTPILGDNSMTEGVLISVMIRVATPGSIRQMANIPMAAQRR